MSSEAGGAVTVENAQGRSLVPERRFPEFRDAGEWQQGTLTDICRIFGGGTPDTNLANFWDGGVPWITPAEMGKGDTPYIASTRRTITEAALRSSSAYLLPKNSIILSTRAPIGLLAINEVAMAFNQGCRGLVPKPGNETYFVYSLLAKSTLALQNLGAGSTFKELSGSALAGFSVLRPSSAEQQKIADCLSSLDAVIAAEGERLAALKVHKKGLMQALFPAPGQTTPRLRFPESQGAGEWQATTLGEICNVAQGFGFPEAIQGKELGDYPFCKVSDISRAVAESGAVLSSAVNYVDQSDLKALRARTIPPGATVFAKIGEALRLNRRAITAVECLIDNNAVALIPKAARTADYFLFLLSQQIDMNEHCGGAVPSVNKSTLEAITIFAPKLEEQQEIADSFLKLDALITQQSAKLSSLESHKSGLMQQLFPSTPEASG